MCLTAVADNHLRSYPCLNDVWICWIIQPEEVSKIPVIWMKVYVYAGMPS